MLAVHASAVLRPRRRDEMTSTACSTCGIVAFGAPGSAVSLRTRERHVLARPGRSREQGARRGPRVSDDTARGRVLLPEALRVVWFESEELENVAQRFVRCGRTLTAARSSDTRASRRTRRCKRGDRRGCGLGLRDDGGLPDALGGIAPSSARRRRGGRCAAEGFAPAAKPPRLLISTIAEHGADSTVVHSLTRISLAPAPGAGI